MPNIDQSECLGCQEKVHDLIKSIDSLMVFFKSLTLTEEVILKAFCHVASRHGK